MFIAKNSFNFNLCLGGGDADDSGSSTHLSPLPLVHLKPAALKLDQPKAAGLTCGLR